MNEEQNAGESAEEYAKRLAKEKAESAAAATHAAGIVLGADTIVVHDGRVLGKPADSAEAIRLLSDLRGKEHTVITAIALIDSNHDRLKIDLCKTSVPMRQYAIPEMEGYVASGDPLDKAGAYAIQNSSFNPVAVERMTGCYANVMGLPLCHLLRSMRLWGYIAPKDVPRECIRHTRYDCRVYPSILDHSL